MRWLVVALLPLSLHAQYTLYAAMTETREYVVGAKLPPSGLFRMLADGSWKHEGFNHPFIFAVDYDPALPSTIYMAAGNGLIRGLNYGQNWRILTGSDVTELRDVSVDRNSRGVIYFAHSHGIQMTRDGAKSAPRSIADSLRPSASTGVLAACWFRGAKKAFSAAKTRAKPGASR